MARALFATVLLLTPFVSATVLSRGYERLSSLTVPEHQFGLLSHRFNSGSMLFVGDIMLGRAVELLMDTEGSDAPFAHVAPFITRYDRAVGNFEASVPEVHVPTPSFGMQFSVKEDSLRKLGEVGFDILSLANNHAYDHGVDGYVHTRLACDRASITCAGNPYEVATSSIVFTSVGDTTVSILMLHTLFGGLSTTTISTLVHSMTKASDIQFAFVHWGEEYVRVHSDAQEELAHLLIDSGIDAVIGHHPHVIQDIEEYGGKPIFYSLGNFIFDQFWNNEVQTGLALGVHFDKRTVSYEIIPHSSVEKRSVPLFMNGEAREAVLSDVLASADFTDNERRTGVLVYAR